MFVYNLMLPFYKIWDITNSVNFVDVFLSCYAANRVYSDVQLCHSIATAILQAHQGMAQLTSGKASTMREIANKLKMDRSYLARTLQLANLAPDIVKLIWENCQPETLTLDKLRKGIPESREEQRKLFLP